MSDEKEKQKRQSFGKKIKDDFPSFYLFHQVFSPPVCQKIHPLFRRSTLRKFSRI